MHPRVTPEPGPLSAHESLGGRDRYADRLVDIASHGAPIIQTAEELRIAEGFAGCRTVPQPVREQLANLVEPAEVHHAEHPSSDPLVEVSSVQTQLDAVVHRVEGGHARDEGLASQLDDLESANDPPTVAGQNVGGGLRVHALQTCVQGGRAAPAELAIESPSDKR